MCTCQGGLARVPSFSLGCESFQWPASGHIRPGSHSSTSPSVGAEHLAASAQTSSPDGSMLVPSCCQSPWFLPRGMGLACLISLFNPERPDKVRSRGVGPASPLGQYRSMHVLDPSLVRDGVRRGTRQPFASIHSCQLCTILARVHNPVHAMPPAYLLPPPLPTSIFAKMGCGDTHSLGSPGGYWLGKS